MKREPPTTFFRDVHGISLLVILLGTTCGWPSVLLGAPQDSERKIARAVRVEESPKIDGDLDEAVWQGVPATTEFTQRDPTEGEPVIKCRSN